MNDSLSRRDRLHDLIVEELLSPLMPKIAEAIGLSIASGKKADMEAAYKVLALMETLYERDAADVRKVAELVFKQAKGLTEQQAPPEQPAEPPAAEGFLDTVRKEALQHESDNGVAVGAEAEAVPPTGGADSS